MSELTEINKTTNEQSQNELADINTISTSEGSALNSDAVLIAELFRQLEIERHRADEERHRADEERHRADEERHRADGAQGIGLLPTLGFPPLGYFSGGSSSSEPSYHDTSSSKQKDNNENNLIMRRTGTFAILNEYELANIPKNKESQIWKQVKTETKTLPTWNHEDNLKLHVKDVLEDIMGLTNISGLSASIEVFIETKKIRSDVLMFKLGGFLISICEVKKTSRTDAKDSTPTNDLKDDRLNKQIYDNLRATMYHGVKYPLGIVSTYNEWMLVWLPESDKLANIVDAKEIKNINTTEEDLLENTFYCSNVYQRTDVKLIEMLVSLIIKVVNAPRNSESTFLRKSNAIGRKHAKIDITKNENTFGWEMLPTVNKGFKLQYSMPSSDTQYLYLLEDYHGGADGRVWLACNSGGRLVVVKYSKENNFSEEAKLWNEIWEQNTVITTTTLGCNAVFMPFTYHALCRDGKISFKPLSHWSAHQHEDIDKILNSEISDKLDNDEFIKYSNDPWLVAREAITEMANKGYEHADLHWRHVALLPVLPTDNSNETKLWKVKPILIDLHRVNKISPEQIEEVIIKSEETLSMELENNKQTMKMKP